MVSYAKQHPGFRGVTVQELVKAVINDVVGKMSGRGTGSSADAEDLFGRLDSPICCVHYTYVPYCSDLQPYLPLVRTPMQTDHLFRRNPTSHSIDSDRRFR